MLLLLLQAFKTILHVVRRETYKLPSGSSVARLRDSLVQILNFWIIQTSPNLPHFAPYLPISSNARTSSVQIDFLYCISYCSNFFVLFWLPWIFLTVPNISIQCNWRLSLDFNACSDIHLIAKPCKDALIMWSHLFFPSFMNKVLFCFTTVHQGEGNGERFWNLDSESYSSGNSKRKEMQDSLLWFTTNNYSRQKGKSDNLRYL